MNISTRASLTSLGFIPKPRASWKLAAGLCAGLVLAGWLTAPARAAAGATTPFTTVEAEDGTLAGGATVRTLAVPVTPPNYNTTYSSPELEASGRSFVQMTATGQSVSWTNPVANANGINVRFCIPDAVTGGGTTATLDLSVNGSMRQAITLSSSQAYLYETSIGANGCGSANDAPSTSGGTNPHVFWDEAHVFISGAAVPAGATITLTKDSANTAAFYYIDCADIEAVPAPISQPAGSLSITSYGAVAGGTVDCTSYIQNCANAAKISGQVVWIPQGKFLITSEVSLTNVTVEGAGMWYSTIYKNPSPTVRSKIDVVSSTIENVNIDCSSKFRGIPAGGDYGIIASGTGWLVSSVWLQHTQTGVWASGTNGTVQNCRIVNTFADGINLNNGNDGVGDNLTAKNNFIRGTGDDCMAVFANDPNGTGTNMNTVLVDHNTCVAPWWADSLRVAGGQNVTVSNNLLTDPTTHNGIVVGIFGAAGFPLVSSTITDNVIERGGGFVYPQALNFGGGAATQGATATFSGNIIDDALFVGAQFTSNTTLTYGPGNVINAPGTSGVVIPSGVTGVGGTISNNTVVNLGSGQVAYSDASPTTYPVTLTSNNWQITPPLANGTYTVIARNSALALDAVGRGTVNGTTLDQWTPNGQTNQAWTLTSVGGNVYKIIGVGSGRAVEVPGASITRGVVLDIYDYDGENSQLWTLAQNSSGYYTATNLNSGLDFDVTGGLTTPGTAVEQWTVNGGTNQQWTFNLQ